MVYAFIKDTVCINIVVFESEEQANAFKETFIRDGFIDDSVLLEEDSQFGIGDIYENGTWNKKQNDVEQIKQEKINQSKQLLSEFLETHHLLYNDEYYSVTQEKQALLTSAIAAYQLKVQAGVPAVLKWNTTGDVCREFTLEEITGLVIVITDYVQPRVERQQELEIQIKNCTTIEELDNIIIDYEVV